MDIITVVTTIALLLGIVTGDLLGRIHRLGNRKVAVSFGGFILAYGIYGYIGLTLKLQILAWSAGIFIRIALSLVDSGATDEASERT